MLGRELYGPPSLETNQSIRYPHANVTVKVDLALNLEMMRTI